MDYMNIYTVFMSRNRLSLRSPGHVGQLLPNDIKNVIINNILDFRVKKYYKKWRIRWDKHFNYGWNAFGFEYRPNKVIAQKWEKNVVVRTQNQERIRITCLLTVCADGDKLQSYIILREKIKIIVVWIN